MIELIQALMAILILNLGNPSWNTRHDIHVAIEKDKNPVWINLLHEQRKSKDLEIRFRIRRLLKVKIRETPLVWFAEKKNRHFFYLKENQVMTMFNTKQEIPNWFKDKHFGPLNVKDKRLGVKLLEKAIRVKGLSYTDETWCIDQLIKVNTPGGVAVLLGWLKTDPTDTRTIGALYKYKSMTSLQALFWAYTTLVYPVRHQMAKRIFWSWDEGKHRGWKSIPQIYEEAVGLFPKRMIKALAKEVRISKNKESMEAFAYMVTQGLRAK